jgi:hypothetical protein
MNKIEKVNMTKFDYTARKLGIVGLFIITITLAFCGTVIINLFMENQTLINALAKTQDLSEKQKNDGDIGIQDYILIID